MAAIFISCKSLTKSFGARPLFEKLSLGLFEGERTGLIGPNGAGKSTLLRILAGVEKPDEGEVSSRRGLRVGYLAQQDRFEAASADKTVRDEAAESLSGLGLDDWEVDMRVEQGLQDTGFLDPNQEINSLSGGWRKRLAILCQTIREPDLLLLDEPTNHLDLEGVLWLEGFLSGLRFSYMVVTHDRRFLERVTNRIIELDKRYPEGHFSTPGNYSQFLEKRQEFLDNQEATEASLTNTVREEIRWLRRGAKARTTKQQARIDRAGELIEDLAELKFRNAQGKAADIDFTGSDRQTRRLIEGLHIEKSMGGRKLFGPLDIRLAPGDKLGLLGENGSGKSTLLKILAGTLQPDAGVMKRADALRVVTFDQHRDHLDLDESLQRSLCPIGEHVEYKGNRIHVRGWAARFLFRQEQLHMPLRMLSGGEQSRVLIARLMLQSADVLLLDEPTNDLDLRSLEVLEQSMVDFPGALVLVTHDRYLLDRVSQSILALDGRGGARYYAELSQWETWRESQKDAPAAAAPPPPVPAKHSKEQRALESEIQGLEKQLHKAHEALEAPAIASDHGELAKRQAKVDELKRSIDALYAKLD
jgi:ABC transport system ATP-binding/permease protein